MIPVEVGEPSGRRMFFQPQHNEENMRVELEWREEDQEVAKVREEAVKQRAMRIYNSKVRPRTFHEGDLVWRVRGEARKVPRAGKLGPNWEGPFRVVEVLGNGAYRLQHLDGCPIPRTWNATHLKFYFS